MYRVGVVIFYLEPHWHYIVVILLFLRHYLKGWVYAQHGENPAKAHAYNDIANRVAVKTEDFA